MGQCALQGVQLGVQAGQLHAQVLDVGLGEVVLVQLRKRDLALRVKGRVRVGSGPGSAQG